MFRRCTFLFCFLESQHHLFKGETQETLDWLHEASHKRNSYRMATPRDDCPFPNYVVLPSLSSISGDEERNVSKDCCWRWWRWLTELDSKRSPAAVCPSAFPTRSSRRADKRRWWIGGRAFFTSFFPRKQIEAINIAPQSDEEIL